jgi:aspartoacylase
VKDVPEKISRVAVSCGTHGNELTGVYLYEKWRRSERALRVSGIEPLVLLANPKAVSLGRRYVDRDLNRCFLTGELRDPERESYEGNRAQVINNALGPKWDPGFDFVIDLHTTTANMGTCLIFNEADKLATRAAVHLQREDSSITCSTYGGTGEFAYLPEVSKSGITIEIGPIPQGVVRAKILSRTEELVHKLLTFLSEYRKGLTTIPSGRLEVYRFDGTIAFVEQRETEGKTFIHPERDGRDYEKLERGDPLLIDLDGEVLAYEEDESSWPIFINEAAYYEKNIAMVLTQKHELSWGE